MCVLGGARFVTVLSSMYWVLTAPPCPCVIAVPFTGEQLQELLRSVYVERVVECIRFVWRWLYVRCLVQIAFLNLVILQTTYLGLALITDTLYFALITGSTL